MKRPDPRQLDLIEYIDAAVLKDRPRWTRDTAVPAFRQHLQAFHDTAVAGDRAAQDRCIFQIDAFIREVHDDSESWEQNSRDGSASTWFTRTWLLQATQHQHGEPLYLGQLFAENAVLGGEPVLVICDGLASMRVTIKGPGMMHRHYWAGLGMTGFHALRGKSPIEYIVSRCVREVTK